LIFLESEEDGSEYWLLQGFLKIEIEVFKLFTNEPNSENRDFLDSVIFASDVGGNFLGNPFPLIPRDFDAAYSCNDLDER
jgi:hypothetical protein